MLRPLLLQIGLTLMFLIWILASPLRRAQKWIVFLSYSLTLAVLPMLTREVPYGANRTVLDFCWMIGPAAVSVLVLVLLKAGKKGRRH